MHNFSAELKMLAEMTPSSQSLQNPLILYVSVPINNKYSFEEMGIMAEEMHH